MNGSRITYDRHIGRAPIGSAVLFVIVVVMLALSRTPQFGLEWLYTGGIRLTTIAWEISPALCLITIAVAGGSMGHRLAMKDVADQLIRERWSRRYRSRPLAKPQDIDLKPGSDRDSVASAAAIVSSPRQE